jgi:hypothetical protein
MSQESDQRDAGILRDLIQRYLEVCALPNQAERRDLWRRHNSLKPTRPLVLVMFGDSWNEVPENIVECTDPLFKTQEMIVRRALFQATLGDDCIFEPWIDEWACYELPAEGRWGVAIKNHASEVAGGAWKFDPALKELDDIQKLIRPHHGINEIKTAEKMKRLWEAVGDLIPVKSVRAPYYRSFRGDLSTEITLMRGMDQLMLDMIDNPEWLHRLLAFMRDAILEMYSAGDRAGDWRLSDHNNQAMPYSQELQDPGAHDRPVACRELWGFMASQETTLVSPAMFDEFMLQYQIPILDRFGLTAYGCCEDLTRKIELLKRIRNLRRIAVTPVADVAKCAEQIGKDYVISWRPNPSIMVCNGWDEARIRRVIREGLTACRGLHVDITLKDVQTVEHQPERLKDWVRIVRETIDGVWE